MSLQILNADGSPITAVSFVIERGLPSAKKAIRIKNNGVTDVVDPFVVLYTETSPGSGLYYSTGHPVADERMGRFQITGVDSSGTPGQQAVIGVIQPLGHLQTAHLPTIEPGNSILADVWMEQPTSSAGGGSVNVKFEVANDQAAYPIPEGVSMVATGIDSGLKQPKSFLISGRAVSVSGPADDEIHVAPGDWIINGVAYTDASTRDVTINQTDGNGLALASDEAYVAVVSQGTSSTPTLTKGAKINTGAGTPLAPSPPPNEIVLATVTVNYSASGSVIQASHVVSSVVYGRYLVEAGTGLNAVVNPGDAVIANFHQVNGIRKTVSLAASSTNRIWLEANGNIVRTTSDTPPSPAALKLADVATDASSVTSVVDTRVFLGVAATVTPHAASHGTAGGDPVTPASIGAAAVADLALKAPLASPAFTGTPTAPTAANGTSTTQLATTAFVQDAIANGIPEQVLLFAGNGVDQPPALSPAPAAGTIVDVYRNGLMQDEGAGRDYTLVGAQITFTPVLGPTDKAHIRWRG